MDGEFQLEVNALSFSVICSPIATRINVSKYSHLDGLEFADDISGGDESIDILLGADYYFEIVTGEIIKGEDGPTAVGSKFGWLLIGPVCNNGARSEFDTANLTIHGHATTAQQSDENEVLANTLKAFWEVESLGIVERETPSRRFLENIEFNGRRYEVGLPWKNDEEDLVSRDFELCEGRLKSLLNKLKKDPELYTEYDTIIQEQIKNEIVETVPVQEQDASDVHYLPHHGVVRREKETTKLRIVFDGSAKGIDGRCSINDHLETGPNFIPSLFDVLVKFRCHPVALTADIEKAFLQIQVKQVDRDKLRFLWVDDHTSKEPKVVQLRFCRLVFGLKPSPAILGATVHHHLAKYEESDPEAVKVLQDLYVDDLPAGASDDKKAFEIYKNTKKIMKEGGFNLRKWKSNSKELTKRINQCERVNSPQIQKETPAMPSVVEDDRSYVESVVSTQSNDDGKTKILGINWDTENDELFFNFSEITSYASQLPPTKRTVLKTAAKFFDPLGFVSPVTVRLKMMFQGLCKDKADWDEELQEVSRQQFEGLIAEMQRLSGLAIPRCYFSPITKSGEIHLHGFSDASERAFAAVVYLRTTYENGVVDVRLVAAKSKVCPIKEQTIPRLELLGANILTRLTDSVSTALKPNVDNIRIFHWTDSSAVLCWIRNEKPWKQYVNQRVREIRNLTEKESWNHCPGVMNPADLPSRGVRVDEMISNTVWWNGPEFLRLPESEWPIAPFE